MSCCLPWLTIGGEVRDHPPRELQDQAPCVDSAVGVGHALEDHIDKLHGLTLALDLRLQGQEVLPSWSGQPRSRPRAAASATLRESCPGLVQLDLQAGRSPQRLVADCALAGQLVPRQELCIAIPGPSGTLGASLLWLLQHTTSLNEVCPVFLKGCHICPKAFHLAVWLELLPRPSHPALLVLGELQAQACHPLAGHLQLVPNKGVLAPQLQQLSRQCCVVLLGPAASIVVDRMLTGVGDSRMSA